mmetsp:Transcript_25569/g.66093  ORF Transcript_25569/g.66093 Transcript_25569/m.66093 type:complete len:213 (-) Transcript_25569:528-1166(-)
MLTTPDIFSRSARSAARFASRSSRFFRSAAAASSSALASSRSCCSLRRAAAASRSRCACACNMAAWRRAARHGPTGMLITLPRTVAHALGTRTGWPAGAAALASHLVLLSSARLARGHRCAPRLGRSGRCSSSTALRPREVGPRGLVWERRLAEQPACRATTARRGLAAADGHGERSGAEQRRLGHRRTAVRRVARRVVVGCGASGWHADRL